MALDSAPSPFPGSATGATKLTTDSRAGIAQSVERSSAARSQFRAPQMTACMCVEEIGLTAILPAKRAAGVAGGGECGVSA